MMVSDHWLLATRPAPGTVVMHMESTPSRLRSLTHGADTLIMCSNQ